MTDSDVRSAAHQTGLGRAERSVPATDAVDYIPGGVHSSIRRFDPTVNFVEAAGSRLYDLSGKEYLDYHGAFGCVLLGHRDKDVDSAIRDSLDQVDLVGAGVTPSEVEISRRIVDHIPSAERILLTNTGSEATYHAIRVSRAVTGRTSILKFQGSYHGWHDAVAVSVRPYREESSEDRLSAGSLQATTQKTLTAVFNDIATVERAFEEHGSNIAAVLVEPIQHGIGCILPQPGFLESLREITRAHGTVLIFDEVITGFRHALGGYQSVIGVTPDLTTLGKAMANGFPIAAIAGRSDIMERFDTDPRGDVFFAGTFNGHPLSSAAAIATHQRLLEPGAHEHLYALGERMREGLSSIGQGLPFPTCVAGYGSVYILYFREEPPTLAHQLVDHDTARFMEFRRRLSQRGIFEPPMDLKRCHISLAHTEEDVDRTLNVAEDVLTTLPR
jgi:glutamate-1-semialdehyde 2,1-aminomutase